jgi:hypothetical protein
MDFQVFAPDWCGLEADVQQTPTAREPTEVRLSFEKLSLAKNVICISNASLL